MPEVKTAEDAYALAKRAAWADDVAQCRAWLAVLRELTGGREGAAGWSPPALLRRAGDALGGRLKEGAVPPEAFVVDTGHLRGVVWQTDRREFELRAYLTDPEWEDELFRQARLVGHGPGVTLITGDDQSAADEKAARQVEMFAEEARVEIEDGLGVAWEEDAGGMLCEATVSELGLVRVKGIWTRLEPPREPGEVTRRLVGVLARLEAAGVVNTGGDPAANPQA